MTPENLTCPACGAGLDLSSPAAGSNGQALCSACSASTPATATGPEGIATPPSGRAEVGSFPPPRDETVGDFATLGPSAPETALNWQDGTLVADRFRIVRFVSQGGMGKVFLAQDETLGRPIALKCVPQEILFDGDARDDLRQEASRLLDLAHDNIVRIHTYYDGPTWPFFAMEFLQGPTLKQLLRDRKHAGKLPGVDELLFIARQVGQGLAHAHAKGIIHRDLKPGNLMLAEASSEPLGQGDLIKITDFGVSRVVADSTLRQTGKRSGTLPYMSPEQFRGEPCTVESDIYSFACTLYEIFQGTPPFHTGEIGYQILHLPPPPFTREIPRLIREAIFRGLAKQPVDRFRSVEAFVQALHGETLPVRRAVSRWVGAAALVGLGLVVAVAMAAFPHLGDRSEVSKAPVRQIAPLAPTETQKLETEEFLRRLRDELGKQIPAQIGREFADKMGSAPGTASFRFRMPEHRSSSHQRSLLERLVLQYTGDEAKDQKGELKGKLLEGAKVFELENFKQGWYSLRAFLTRPDGSGADLVLEIPHKFRIDLSPPSFEVLPVRPEAFINASPPLHLTFFEAVDFKLHSTGDPGDIAEAFTSLSFGDSAMRWVRLQNQPEWRMERLPPGVTTTHRIYATDAVGNRSAALEVSVRRLKLEVDSFGLALPEGVTGNLATVTGVLRVEGEQSPSLCYFVKDLPVVPESTGTGTTDTEFEVGGLWRDPSGIPFSAVLRLPSVTNTIEVRFAWKDNAPQPFARPMRITDVKVRAPRLSLEELPRRTAVGRVKLAGSIDPYFEGLELGLERKGQSSQRLGLSPSALASSATFAQDVELLEGENTFLVSFYYRGDPLSAAVASQKAFSIYSDKVPPGLEGPVRFEPAGDELFVIFRPAEELAELRVEESASGQEGTWRTLEKDPGGRTYTHVFPIPFLPKTLRLEMTDLAGLVGRSTHLCPITRADLEGGDITRIPRSGAVGVSATGVGVPVPAVEGQREGPPVLTPAVAADLSLPSGVTIIAAPFVRESGMEFVPLGADRLEIARTEISERAWFSFLAERQQGLLKSGDLETPMVLLDHPPELLEEFLSWFEVRANDGYTYSIPTEDEWLVALAGIGDVERAREVIRGWVRDGKGELEGAPVRNLAFGVQEIVRKAGQLRVMGGIGASSSAGKPRALEGHCLEARAYDAQMRKTLGQYTGARLVRRPR